MNKIKKLRQEKKLSQKELADMIPVNQTAISQWEREITSPNPAALKILCKIFNTTSDYLLGFDEQPKKQAKGIKIPVLGHVAAGIPLTAIQDIIDYEEITENMAKSGEYFGLVIKGDSMEPRMTTGDVIIIRCQSDVDTGDIAVVMVNGDEATCKKIKKTPEGVMLIAINPAYEPQFYSNRQIEELPVRVIGKVVELRAKF